MSGGQEDETGHLLEESSPGDEPTPEVLIPLRHEERLDMGTEAMP